MRREMSRSTTFPLGGLQIHLLMHEMTPFPPFPLAPSSLTSGGWDDAPHSWLLDFNTHVGILAHLISFGFGEESFVGSIMTFVKFLFCYSIASQICVSSPDRFQKYIQKKVNELQSSKRYAEH